MAYPASFDPKKMAPMSSGLTPQLGGQIPEYLNKTTQHLRTIWREEVWVRPSQAGPPSLARPPPCLFLPPVLRPHYFPLCRITMYCARWLYFCPPPSPVSWCIAAPEDSSSRVSHAGSCAPRSEYWETSSPPLPLPPLRCRYGRPGAEAEARSRCSLRGRPEDTLLWKNLNERSEYFWLLLRPFFQMFWMTLKPLKKM